MATGIGGFRSHPQDDRYVAGFGFPALDDFGERVRAVRRQRGLSQEALGTRAGLHRTYIGHIERGEVNPSLKNVLLVSQALEIDPGELLRGLQL